MKFSINPIRIAVIASAGCALAGGAHGNGGLDCAVGGVQIALPSTPQPATYPKPGLAQVLIHCKPAAASLSKAAPNRHHTHPRSASGAQVWSTDQIDATPAPPGASSTRAVMYSTQTGSFVPAGPMGH